jgi:hypothetical protein
MLLAALILPLGLVPVAKATVQRIVVVQVDNVDAYLKELRHGQELLVRMGSVQKLRVWRPRFAGSDVGTLAIAVEYPDLAAYAEDEKKVAADAEFQAWIKNLARQRKIVSDSLHDELKL